ncbi:MAG: M48 family metalloprotease [Methylophilaceae bacterium]|nr:M48 family metalloprotease [Methylophilaceae bacterium]
MKCRPSTLLSIILLLTASYQAQALNLGDALKDVVKEKAGEYINPDKSNSEPSGAAKAGDNNAATSTPAPAPSQPAFNLKNPSQADEIQLGRKITGNLLGAAPLVKDEALQKYVNQVGRWVASQSERADLPWHFGVVESNDINAFAAPGGYVIITKGLYRKLENEAQLAGVLGHEISHVVKKHQLKLLQKTQLLDFGARLLSKKLGNENQTVEKIIGSGAEVCARSLDKEAEFEADRMGLVLATRAGYAPFGLPEVLQSISQITRNDGSVALLFKTHPAPDDRLVSLGNAIGSKLDNIKADKTLENRFYKLKPDI